MSSLEFHVWDSKSVILWFLEETFINYIHAWRRHLFLQVGENWTKNRPERIKENTMHIQPWCVHQYLYYLLQINGVLGVQSISCSHTMRLFHHACRSILRLIVRIGGHSEQMSNSPDAPRISKLSRTDSPFLPRKIFCTGSTVRMYKYPVWCLVLITAATCRGPSACKHQNIRLTSSLCVFSIANRLWKPQTTGPVVLKSKQTYEFDNLIWKSTCLRCSFSRGRLGFLSPMHILNPLLLYFSYTVTFKFHCCKTIRRSSLLCIYLNSQNADWDKISGNLS